MHVGSIPDWAAFIDSFIHWLLIQGEVVTEHLSIVEIVGGAGNNFFLENEVCLQGTCSIVRKTKLSHTCANATLVNISANPDIEINIYSTLFNPWGFQNFQPHKFDDKAEISPSNLFLLCFMPACFLVWLCSSHSVLSSAWLSSYPATRWSWLRLTQPQGQ